MVQTSLFFYGTLMHPKILKRVIRNDGAHLQLCSALLLVSRLIQACTLFTPCNTGVYSPQSQSAALCFGRLTS